MQRDDAYRIVQRLAQQAWDTADAAARAAGAEPGVGLDLDAIFDYGHYVRHVPEVLARLEVIADDRRPDATRAPERSADLFHAIPLGDHRPVPLRRARRPPRRRDQRARRATRCAALGVEVLDPIALGRDELLAPGLGRLDGRRSSWRCAPCRELGVDAAIGAAGVPARASPTTCAPAGVELTSTTSAFVARRRVKTAAELDGIRRAQKAADAAMGVAAALIRELRAGLDVRGRARGDAATSATSTAASCPAT